MANDPTRFTVVDGGSAKSQTVPHALRRFRCTPCSEEIGAGFSSFVQILRDPHESGGRLVAGSLWWACARCYRPYFRIETFGESSGK